ncbi:MAG: amidohydrolase [Clostridia bacterium]|nr:amidohydrolase [Clostridia bacterium]
MNYTKEIDEYFEELVQLRRYFHQNPELSNEEYNTQRKILEFLKSNNIECHPVANTGVVAVIRGNHEGKTIAFRADIDALPIQEANDTPYKSINQNVMHACGHDVHTTILLGFAKIISSYKEHLKGTVKCFFQPAEETTGGALPMIEAGVLENPTVDYVYGLHVMPYLPVGQIEVKSGQLNASSNGLTIKVKGKQSHAAYPEIGIDAIYIASQIITSLQSIPSRRMSPLNSAVITIGSIHGGTKGNILCDEVLLKGTIRTLSEKDRAFVIEEVKNQVHSLTQAYGGQGDVIIHDGYEALFNHENATEILRNIAWDLIGKENVLEKEKPSMGVEDFSYFSNRVPSSFFHLGCKKSEEQNVLHQNNFDVDESCMKIGIKLFIALTRHLL